MRIRHAMLFAAGLGTRMRPLTDHAPKPLIEVAGKALLDYTLDQFATHGLSRVVVNTHYLADQVERHLATRTTPEIRLSHEPVLLETGGGIVRALPWLGEAPFFSANSDTIWLDGEEPALSRLEGAFDEERLDALLLLHPLDRAVGYRGPGNFDLADDGLLLRTSAPRFVFTGLQILHPRLFENMREEPFSLRVLYERAQGAGGKLARIGGLIHDGEWVHVGSKAELAEANAFFATRKRSDPR